MKKLRRKLKSARGETLTEVLVAVLVAALALVMLAGMISASSNMVQNSRTTMGKYLEKENQLELQNGSEAGSGSVEVTLQEGTSDKVIRLTDGSGDSVAVKYYENQEIGREPVVSYKVKGSGT